MAQIPPMPTRGAWVAACPTCTELFDALTKATFGVNPPIAEHMALTEHVVTQHLALLPAYRSDCANCLEWQLQDPDHVSTMRVGDTTPGPRLVPVLGREDLLHRAGHLIYPDL